MRGRLEGKVALISGAGSCGPGWGNGRATATLFAREGAKVFAVDLNQEAVEETAKTIQDEGNECITYCCDVTNAESVNEMVTSCVDRFGRVDVLQNNVGGSAAGGAMDMEEEVWDKQMDHNLKHVFLVTKAVLPIMVKNKTGSIINMSSTSGLTYGGAFQIAYCTTKAAIRRFSEAVAIEFAGRGVRCNTIIPGQLHTPMVETRLANQRTGGDIKKLIATRNARIPLGQMGDGFDVAYAAVYLGSDESKFVTGSEIKLDGAMTLKCTNLPDDYPTD
ncbi:MAG: SDR family NAD(P)-dependent oxidoreductase [Pseudomonadota bacterium]|nr:SDR family NAD(P)-dependent oxidoreductase [Pseudomonadota bacterium]